MRSDQPSETLPGPADGNARDDAIEEQLAGVRRSLRPHILRTFPRSFRGYDRTAVDTHLGLIVGWLTLSGLDDLVRERFNEQDPLASELRAQAETDAEQLREDARREADRRTEHVREEASRLLAAAREDAGREVARRIEAARDEARRVVDAANQDADEIRARARREADDLAAHARGNGAAEHLGALGRLLNRRHAPKRGASPAD